MSWKDRAQPVDGKTSGGWKSRALPVDAASEEPTTSAGMAALEQYGNTALGGHLPQFQAFVEKMLPNPGADVDAELEAQGFKIQKPDDSYVSLRDKNIERLKTEEKEHPWASTAGKGGGLAASMLLPASKIAKGASLGAKALQGAKTGAALGAIQNPGDIEGEIDPLQLSGRARGAAIGAVVGAAAPVAIQGVSTAADKVGSYLRKKAAEKAFRSLGRGTPQAMQKMVDSGKNVEVGRELLDAGAIPVLGTPGRIQGRVGKLKESAGEEVGSLVKGAGNAKVIDAQKLGVEILDSPELALMRKTPGMESAVASIEKQVETLAKNGTMDLSEAQALRQQIDKSINWSKATPDVGAAQGLKMQRTGIRDAMNEGINNLNPGAPKDQLLAANRKYGNMATADQILEKELARNQSNRAVSLTDTIAAMGGMAHGGPVGAAVLGAANKAGRTFGNSVQARVYDSISKKLGKVPALAEKINPQVAQTIATRAKLGTGDYKRIDDPILKDQRLMDIFRKDPGLIESIQDEKTKSLVRAELKKRGITSDKDSR